MNTFRSNVNKKYCSYFECGNNSVTNPTVTFFAFPKQPDRCETWVKAAGVPEHLVENRMHRFLCERHFPNIYICRSQRRTLLLANAVPYPYKEPGEESDQEEELEIMEDLVEDTTVDSGDMLEAFHDDKDSMDDQQETEPVIINANKLLPAIGTINERVTLNIQPSTSRMDYSRKRNAVAVKIADMKVKLSTSQNEPTIGSPITLNKDTNIKTVQLDGSTVRLVPAPKMLRLTPVGSQKERSEEKPAKEVCIRAALKSPVSSSTNAIEIIEQNDDTSASKSSDDTVLEKDDKISEFIFKGEEYVQMPKEHYLKQINRLKRSAAFYQNIVRNMRELLDQADPTSALDC
ncbi:uncharacterized protein LOC118506442 isoform X2 [Anopheles stephensi]|uniref:Uncharacterized protein n=1 Tax=Anopheles stephensi TaxID=30069 RepID=A0A182Y590_ANOST|nr:uncharacterized protein LOC118506442 isoform X2 [Anopheles stephensi]